MKQGDIIRVWNSERKSDGSCVAEVDKVYGKAGAVIVQFKTLDGTMCWSCSIFDRPGWVLSEWGTSYIHLCEPIEKESAPEDTEALYEMNPTSRVIN
jgi:hypothetical protein